LSRKIPCISLGFRDGNKAYLAVKEDNKMYLIETYTPEQHRGKGYAKMLVEK